MKFSELVRLVEQNRFRLIKEKGSICYTGEGHSIEDCPYKAKWGMEEHIALIKEQQLPVPKQNPAATILIQNDRKLEPVSR